MKKLTTKTKWQRTRSFFKSLIPHLSGGVDKARLERQSAQAQKMQAVGQLAGGMAHDFNNILTAIITACDSLPKGQFQEVQEIRNNAQRGADLVRQLLAFSRRQVMQPVPLDLAQRTEGIMELISRLLGAPIAVKLDISKPLWQVMADPTQLEQIIVNLAVNARDAMSEGGTLTIKLQNLTAEELAKQNHILIPQSRDYVLLEMADTGCGIPKSELGNIFEPFYSTKAEGTGLGLSTVYGIVKQSDGFIFPASEKGKGTTFRIYLPRYEAAPPSEQKPRAQQAAAVAVAHDENFPDDGQRIVLLVEDDVAIREFAARALRGQGFNVITAASAEEALSLQLDRIHVLVSDVVMSGMDGVQLAESLLEQHQQLRIILISGYADDAFRNPAERLAERMRFLPKPFGLQELILAVQAAYSNE